MTATSDGGLALSNENLLAEDGSMPPPLPPLKPGWRQLTRTVGTEHKQLQQHQHGDEDALDMLEDEEAIPSDSLYGSRGRSVPGGGSVAPEFQLGGGSGGMGGSRSGSRAAQSSFHHQQPPPATELAHWSSHGYLAKDSPDSNNVSGSAQHRQRESSGYVLLRRQGEQMMVTSSAQRARLAPPSQMQQPSAATGAAAGSANNGIPPTRFGGGNPGLGGGNSSSPHFGGGGNNPKYFSVKGLKHLGQLQENGTADGEETVAANIMGEKYFSVDSSFLSGHADLRARLKQANGGGGGDGCEVPNALRQQLPPPSSSADNSLDFYKAHSPLHPPSSLDFPGSSQPPPSLPPYQRPPPPPPPSKPQAAAAMESFGPGGGLANSKNISGRWRRGFPSVYTVYCIYMVHCTL